jgi:RHS repeat-associated protein
VSKDGPAVESTGSSASSRWQRAGRALRRIAIAAALALPGAAHAVDAKTVPWVPANPLIPHDAWSGKIVTLKGTADVEGATVQYTWDFGDGTAPQVGTVTSRFAIEAQHAYTGPAGTTFAARLMVLNTATGDTDSASYFVALKPRTLEVEVNVAIDEGLWYLHKTQRRTTSAGVDLGDWLGSGNASSGWYSATAANLNAFHVNGHREFVQIESPPGSGTFVSVRANDANPYVETVERGMRSLFGWLATYAVSSRTNGLGTFDPDANGNGHGIRLNQQYDPYQNGMIMDAIVSSGAPDAVTMTGVAASGSSPGVRGRSYLDVVQDMVDYYAHCQYTGSGGGGWRYSCGQSPDNSANQWGAIGMIAAEREFRATVPQLVKDWNKVWLARTQVASGSAAGQYGYTSTSTAWGPYATTPSGMVQAALDGVGRGDPLWDRSETFLRDRFANTGGATSSLKAYYYGLFSFTKAMLLHDPDGDGQASPITCLQSSTSGVEPLDWYAAEAGVQDAICHQPTDGFVPPTNGVARTLVNDQNPAGYWSGHNYTGEQYPFETAWAIIMLRRTVVDPGVPVAVAEARPNPGVVGVPVTLDGSAAFHLNARKSIDSWEWDVDGDGATDIVGPVVQTPFAALGDYPVRLCVTDNGDDPVLFPGGAEREACTTVVVRITLPPIAPTADADGPYLLCEGREPWFLDGTGSVNPDEGASEPGSPGDTIQSFCWDLDLDPAAVCDGSGPQPDVTAYFTARGEGEFNVTLRVTDTTATAFPSVGTDLSSAPDRAEVRVRPVGHPDCACTTLAAALVGGDVELTWTDTGAHHYNVYRSLTAGGPYTFLASVTGTSHVDASVDPGVTYHYVVREAKLDTTEGCQSNEVSIGVPSDAIRDLACRPKATKIDLTWGPVVGAAEYEVFRLESTGRRLLARQPGTVYADFGLTNGTTYAYAVRWLSAAGRASAESLPCAATPLPTDATAHPPVIVSTPGTRASIGVAYSYDVDATDADPGDVVGYAIDQAPAGMAIDAVTGLVTWTPTTVGERLVVLRAQDVAGRYALQGYVIAIDAVPPIAVPDVVGLAQAAAEAAITAAGFAVGAVTTATDGSVPAGHVIRQTPGGGSSGRAGDPVDLVVSAGPPLTPVPNVVGLAQAAAEAAILGADLVLGPVTQANDPIVPAGFVLGQVPLGGAVVPEGTAVGLVVSLGPVLVAVPDVVGLAQATAEAMILGASLAFGPVATTTSLTVPAGSVISQSPLAGASAPQGSAVSLVVSLGPPTTVVPDVVGLPEAAAGAAITVAGLTLGPVSGDYDRAVPVGLVISQAPPAGSTVAQGSAVTLVVSLGPPLVAVPDVTGQPDAAAAATIAAAGLVVGAVTTQSSVTVPAGSVIAQSPGGGAQAPEGSGVDLVVSTGPPLVAVPDVVGQTQASAQASIVAANLVAGLVATQSSVTVPAGEVISQSPLAGTLAPQGSAVDLVVSAGPALLTVPDVVGQPQANAQAAIVGAGFLVGTIATASSDNVPAGSVISQSLPGGSAQPEGSAIDLVVSTGPPRVAVPDVVGLAQANAGAAIAAAGLAVGTITPASSDTVPAGDVISQSPAGGAAVLPGSTVDLFVSTGPAVVLVTVPDVLGQPQLNAEAAIAAAGLTVGPVSTQSSDTVPAGAVISQDPPGGSQLSQGSIVSLVVSTGPPPVAVPDVVGVPQSTAEAAIVAAGLVVGTVTNASSNTVPAGSVILQSPLAGSQVAGGTAVDLVVSTGPGTTNVTVPDVVGQPQASGEAAIVAAGLVVGNVSTQPNLTVPAGAILDQSPPAGASVASGSAIDLVVSSGPLVDFLRPQVSVLVSPPSAPVGSPVTITVVATDDDAVASLLLNVDGTPVALGPSGTATFSSPTAGIFQAVATASDPTGNQGQASEEFRFLQPGDTTPPTVSLGAPAADARIAVPTDVVGTASDANLLRYVVELSPKDQGQFVTIASGSLSVTNGVLGTLDPSTFRNGLYDLVLSAEDQSGNVASASRTVQLEGELKVGNFTISFTDLTIPVSGIPITITRTYDSRVKTKGDFGVGWTLDVKSTEIQENRVPGVGWTLVCTQSVFGICLQWGVTPAASHTVVVTADGVPSQEFVVQAATSYADGSGLAQGNLTFTARPGTRSSLQALDSTTFDLLLGGELLDFGFEIVDPDRYQLTDTSGTVFVLNQGAGVESITEPNGNRITLGASGIIHSTGKSVTFTRDAQGRITAITDPNGNTTRYEYDFYGDLVRVVDAGDDATRFTYNSSHGLLDIVDPRGITPARNEYDAEGRLVATIDGAGNRIEFDHDVTGRQEVVTDRRGNPTVLTYDASGNVTSETDALGNVTARSFDASGNKLAETSPLGHTTSFAYDAAGNQLSETDPLGNTTSYAYDARGNPLVVTDAAGATTTNTYDARGNVLSTVDALGNVTSNTFNAAGKPLTVTDPLGNVTTRSYDASGNALVETDPLGRVSTFSYDANGNKRTETRTRTDALGAVVSMTTTWAYDRENRVVAKIDPLGGTERTEYDALGKLAAEIDANGNRKEYQYDARGNLVETRFPDGTRETASYDAEGNRTAVVDRAGGTTSFVYDALDRLTRTVHADGGVEVREYDADGRLTRIVDENGNETRFGYDAAGHRTSETNALGGVTLHTYDPVGRPLTTTDANGSLTRFEYDVAGRRIRTIHPNGSVSAVGYDARGTKTSETDQAGNVTRFEYDAAGRLLAVVDALGGRTEFAYDEVGNRIEQRDANGAVTRWAYDSMGRVTSHTLPLGMTETFAYDPKGNLVSHTDFNGDTTLLAYDTNDRLVRKTYDDGSEVELTYTPLGEVATATDASGLTRYTYDSRSRLVRTENPNGSTIDYAHDAAGNRISITTARGTTTYAYDAVRRLIGVTAPGGGTTSYSCDAVGNRIGEILPNGVATSYAYDSLHRLVALSTSEAGGGVLASYAYTLGPAGNRLRVDEAGSATTSRSVSYVYDALYRLTREQIDEPGANDDRTIDYTYDATGNRLARSVAVGTRTSATLYTYDANDRLLSAATGTTIAMVPGAGPALASGSAQPTQAGEGSARPPSGSLARLARPVVLAPFLYVTIGLLILAVGLSQGALHLALAVSGARRRWSRARRAASRAVTLLLVLGLAFDARLVHALTVGAYPGEQAVAAPSATPLPPELISYSYDANGRTLSQSDGARTDVYAYDYENRLIRADVQLGPSPGTVTYGYDHDGVRTRRTVGGVTTDFLVDKSRENPEVLEEVTGPDVATYVHGDELISQTRASGPRFYHHDGNLSVRQLTDAAGAVTDTYTFDAFGVALAVAGSSPNDFLYVGEQLDANVGFYHLRARYLSQAIGRFTTADPFDGVVFDPPSLHKYAYANDDPVNKVDPGGNFAMALAYPISIGLPFYWSQLLLGLFAIGILGVLVAIAIKKRPIRLNHYTRFERLPAIMNPFVGITPSAPGRSVYFTPDWYFDSATAKSRLALPEEKDLFINLTLFLDGDGLSGFSHVAPNFGECGCGTETSTGQAIRGVIFRGPIVVPLF